MTKGHLAEQAMPTPKVDETLFFQAEFINLPGKGTHTKIPHRAAAGKVKGLKELEIEVYSFPESSVTNYPSVA